MESSKEFYFVVGAVFKDEEDSIREWTEHYLRRGADKIFMINDESKDRSLENIKEYVAQDKIEVYHPKGWPRTEGRQRNMYNHYFLPLLKKSRWLLIADLDEYIWSPKHPKLSDMLKECEHIAQIQINNTVFGSNGHVQQPKSIVSHFTRRTKESPSQGSKTLYKYIVNSDYEFTSLNVHHASFKDKSLEKTHFVKLEDPWFVYNHYFVQSKDYYLNVKCNRGDVNENSFGSSKYTLKHFEEMDDNTTEDLRLIQQNKKYF